MKVPPVDKNLYVMSLRNRDIPYETRFTTFDNQNSKTKKPNIPPGHSSLTTNYKSTVADLST